MWFQLLSSPQPFPLDLQLAATLEPTNKTVKDELALVQDIFRPKKVAFYYEGYI